MTAYHEAAHAVLSYLLLPHIKIEQVTIAPRSKMLGFVSYNAEDQISNVTKEEIFNDIWSLANKKSMQRYLPLFKTHIIAQFSSLQLNSKPSTISNRFHTD